MRAALAGPGKVWLVCSLLRPPRSEACRTLLSVACPASMRAVTPWPSANSTAPSRLLRRATASGSGWLGLPISKSSW